MNPNLKTPFITGIAGAFCLWCAWKIKMPDWFHALLVITGVALFLVAAATGGDYFMWLIGKHLNDFRSAWYHPYIRITDTVARMSPAQLAFVQEVVPLRMIGKFGVQDELSWWISAPSGDIPMDFLGEYLEQCQEEGWKTLPPQHGMPDSMAREYVKRIHELMEWRGFASKGSGNMRAKWQVAPEVVYQKLGLVE